MVKFAKGLQTVTKWALGVLLILTGAGCGLLALRNDDVYAPLVLVAGITLTVGFAVTARQIARFIGQYGSAPTKDANPEAPPEHRG